MASYRDSRMMFSELYNIMVKKATFVGFRGVDRASLDAPLAPSHIENAENSCLNCQPSKINAANETKTCSDIKNAENKAENTSDRQCLDCSTCRMLNTNNLHVAVKRLCNQIENLLSHRITQDLHKIAIDVNR